MKKIYLFAAMAVMGVSTLACSSDDNSSTPEKANYQEAIQGDWKSSKIIYLDKDRKVISEEAASNNEGCGVDERAYVGDVVTYTFNFKDGKGECDSDEMIEKFAIDGSKITYTYEEDGIVEVIDEEIISLTKTKLLLLDLDEIEASSAKEEGWPEGTTYIQLEFVRK